MAKKTYNPKNANSILKYGEVLLGRSLRELHPEAVIPSGKGGLGQAVEKFHYGYKPNSDAEPDLKEAGLELKCTPLRSLRKIRVWLPKSDLYSISLIILRKQKKLLKQAGFGRRTNYFF